MPLITQGQSQPELSWKAQYDSAQLFWKIDITKSVYYLQKSERTAINDLGIYDDNYLIILNDLGLAYGQLNDFEKGENYLKKNLRLQQEIYDKGDIRILQSKCNLAAIRVKYGNDAGAKSMYKEVLQSSSVGAGPTYLIAAENLIRLYERNEHFDSALFILNDALANQFTSSSIQTRYALLLAQGRILRKEKKYNEAMETLTALYKQVSAITPTPIVYYSLKMELGLLNIEMGLYGTAEIELLQLYRTVKSIKSIDENLLTELTSGLAYVYEKLNVYDKALVYYQEALTRCALAYGYNSQSCLITQNNIAGIYLKLGQVKEAVATYEVFTKAQYSFENNINTTNLIALNNLATAYRQDGQYTLALQYFTKASEAVEKAKLTQSDLAATIMNNLAVTHTLTGDYSKASYYFERVLTIKERVYGEDSPVLLDVINNLAITYWAKQDYNMAVPLFSRSLQLTHKQINYIFPNLTETEQVQFYEQHKLNFERFNTLSTMYSATQPVLLVHMFNNQLLLKSLVFFTTKKRNEAIRATGDASLKRLAEQIQTKGIQLGHFYQMPLADLQALGVSLTKLESEIDSLEKIIRHTNYQVQSNLEWKDVQESLKEDEALIEIIRFRKYDVLSTHAMGMDKQISIGFTDSVYYAALITTTSTKNFPQLVLLKNGNSIEKRFFSYYKNTLQFNFTDTLSFGKYWKPFESYVANKRKIYLSVDGVFHQMNLNAIRDTDSKFILEKYELISILNAQQLVNRVKETPIDFTKIVLIGPVFDSPPRDIIEPSSRFDYEYLPGTLQEVNGILGALKLNSSTAKVYLRQTANEQNFKRINSPSILHIATHGFFSSERVYVNEQSKNNFLFHSGLILFPDYPTKKNDANAFEHDGIVTAYDVLNLNLNNTNLVVLSACETGLGKIETGEGLYGLQRSFLQAGARDIVLSLWKVDDTQTKELMVKFYSYLGQQQSRRDAFKHAQLDLLHRGENPKHWAAFVMISGE